MRKFSDGKAAEASLRKFPNRGRQALISRVGILAGFRVLSAVDTWGRRMLASDGGSAEVVHALVVTVATTSISGAAIAAMRGLQPRAAFLVCQDGTLIWTQSP